MVDVAALLTLGTDLDSSAGDRGLRYVPVPVADGDEFPATDADLPVLSVDRFVHPDRFAHSHSHGHGSFASSGSQAYPYGGAGSEMLMSDNE